MNNLKEQIQADFVTAMKQKNEGTKLALQGLKTKIIEAEKVNGNVILTDSDIVKLVTKMIKQREESIVQYKSANRTDLVEKEQLEIEALSKYMPKKLTDQEISDICKTIIGDLSKLNLNQNALIGKTIGEFNKQYPGMADVNKLKEIINQLI